MTPFSIYRSGGGTVDAADLKSADESRTGSNPVPSTFVWCAYISAPIGKGKDRVSCCRRREDAASFNGGGGFLALPFRRPCNAAHPDFIYAYSVHVFHFEAKILPIDVVAFGGYALELSKQKSPDGVAIFSFIVQVEKY